MGWSEEISRYLLIWIIYIGIATGIRTDTHIRVDLIDRFGGPWVKRAFDWLTTLLLLVFLVWLCWLFSSLLGRFARLRAPASGLSMAYAYAAVLAGAALGAARLIVTRFVSPPAPQER